MTTRIPTRNVPKRRQAEVSELPWVRSHSRQMAQVFTPPSVSVQQLPQTERRHEAQGPAASREQNAQRSGPSSPECCSWSDTLPSYLRKEGLGLVPDALDELARRGNLELGYN